MSPVAGSALSIFEDGTPLSREVFVKKKKNTEDHLKSCPCGPDGYSGHSFWIRAATTAALAGIPVHVN